MTARTYSVPATGVALLCASLMLSGCVTTERVEPDCQKNFTTEGSFFTGKRFSTSALLASANTKKSFESLYSILASDGYFIQNADEAKGIISSYQNVNLSDKKAPLNAILQKSDNGTKITLVFVAAAGVYTPEDGAKDEFCRIINRVGN